ncbi:MAG: iron ABC transporter permease [Candidatus Limnocylindrales bacterium]
MVDARRGLGTLVIVGALAALVAYPLSRLAATLGALGPEAMLGAFDGVGARAVVTSIGLGITVAALAVCLGTIAALVGERASERGRWLVRAVMVGSLLVPPFVSALGWAAAFGPRGLTDRAIGISLPGMYGLPGLIVVLTTESIPLAYIVIAAALAGRDEADLERAARASGATAGEALRTITLPLLRRPILGAAVLVFVMTLNAFGVPAVLGIPGGISTITTRLYQDLAFSADPASFDRAVVLAMLLVAIAFVTVAVADRLLGGTDVDRTAVTSSVRTKAGRRNGLATGLVVAAVGLTAAVPFIALILVALTRAVGLPPTPENWTLANFGEVLDPRAVGALVRSVGLALVAATVVTILGGLVVAVGRRSGRVLGTVVSIGFAVPGSTLALAVLIGYGGVLRDTLAIILVAYLGKFWALGHRPIAGSVDRLPIDLLRAARASGARPRAVLTTIVVPLLRPAIVGAWLIVFLFGVHEVTMSSLLYGPGTDTLAVVTLNVQQLGDPTITAALAVVLTLVVLLAAAPILLLRRAADRPLGRE